MSDKKLEFLRLYWEINAELDNQFRDLYKDYTNAVNLACSTWSETIAGFQPTSIDPEKLELVNKNLVALQDKIQYKKYLITSVFKEVLGDEILNENYHYWKEKDVDSGSSSC